MRNDADLRPIARPSSQTKGRRPFGRGAINQRRVGA